MPFKSILGGMLGLILLLTACGDDPADPATPAAEQASLPQVQVTVSEALVFNIPSREAAILFRLIEGDRVPAIAKTPPDVLGVIWYQVAQGETFGWIAGSQVTPLGAVETLPTVPSSVWEATSTPLAPTAISLPSTTPTLGPAQGTVATNDITLYDQPSPTSNAVGLLLTGQRVDLVGQFSAEGQVFYLVGENQRVLGWVQASDLTLEGDLASIPRLESNELTLSAFQTPASSPTLAASPTESIAPSSATLPPTSTARFTPSTTPNLASTALQAPTATDLPTSPTPSPSPTEEIVLIEGVPPPLTFELPADWQTLHLALPINNAYLQGNMPFSVYHGPLPSGGIGTLWLIWGFPNITSPSGQINLYADGVQLLRSLVLDASTCNIGLGDEQRQYFIGEREAVGTIFSAVDCAETGDIAGFFAVLQVDGGNFAFFAGVEPVDKVNPGSADLQALLNTVQFEAQP